MRLPLFSLRPFYPAVRPAGLVFALVCVLLHVPSGAAAAPDAPVSSTVAAAAAPLPPAASVQAAPTIRAVYDGLALTPFVQYLLDPLGTWTVEEVSREHGADFQPYDARALPRQAGSCWLRFRLAALPATAGPLPTSDQALLDLGDQIPGQPRVWVRPGQDEQASPVPVEPDGAGLFPLTALSTGGEAFVRLDGLPGLWFTPALRTLPQAMVAPERHAHPLILAALTALLLLCLVRSVTERGDGRLWAGIFTGAALLHAFWGVPSTPRGTVIPWDMPGLLAAGVALMLLPHVGRNIMRTRDTSPRLDMVLLFLALPGAALAVLPLMPGLAWTARLLALWPLGAAFALLPAFLLLLRGVPGSGLFTLACLGMVGGGILALWGMDGALVAPLWAQGPLAGVTFAALLLAAAAPRSAYAEPETDEMPENATASRSYPGILPEEPLLSPADPGRSLRLEEILRAPLDALLREACSIDQILERPSEHLDAALTGQDAQRARRHADNLVAAARELTALVTNLPRLNQQHPRPESVRQPFNLLRLIREVFADVEKELTDKDLALSWYIAPHLGLRYKGDRDRLRFVLTMLVADAIRATARGAVSLRVRRADMSSNPGHLQFTVADTGAGTPPLRRSSLALAKAWELASDHHGDLFVDSTPAGVEITLTLDCVALAEDGLTARPVPPGEISGRNDNPETDLRLVILAAPAPLDRQMLAFFLDNQGQTVWEARDAEEAVALYSHTPAALVVFDGHLPEEDIVTAIAAIRVFEGEHTLSAVPFLALTEDENQAERLHQAGCDHSLPLPVVRGEFRAMTLHLASPSGAKPRPTIVPHRVPPSRFLQARAADVPGANGAASHTASPAAEPPSFLPLELQPPTPIASEATLSATVATDLERPASTPLPIPPTADGNAAKIPVLSVPSPETADRNHKSASRTAKKDKADVDSMTPEHPSATKRPTGSPSTHLHAPAPRRAATPVLEEPASAASIPASPRLDTSSPSIRKPPISPAPQPGSFPLGTSPAPSSSTDAPASAHAESRRPVPAQGLLIPPAPKKRLGWLTSIFKPTPKVAPPLPDDDVPSTTEWVGEPMPIPSAAHVPSLFTRDAAEPPNENLMPAHDGSSPVACADTVAAPSSLTFPDASIAPIPEVSEAQAAPNSPAPFIQSIKIIPLDETLEPAETPALPLPTDTPEISAPCVDTDEPVPDSEAVDAPSAALVSGPGPAQRLGPVEKESIPPEGDASPSDKTGKPVTDAAALTTAEALRSRPDEARDSLALSSPADAVPLLTSEETKRPEPAQDTTRTKKDAPTAPPPPLRPSASPERRPPGSRNRRKKGRLDELPFLSLDPHYTVPASDLDSDGPEKKEPADESAATPFSLRIVERPAAPEPATGPNHEDTDDIVELTEEDMVDSPLLQQVPDLLRSLDAAVEHAAAALDKGDAWGLVNAADRMADRAVAFGLHALSDLALCLKDAAQNRDFDAAAQLLPDLRAEVERHRR